MTVAPLGIQVQVGARPRDPRDLPAEDEALGERLGAMVRGALGKGVPPPAALVLRGELVELVDLRPILASGLSVHRFLAALAGQPAVEALALLAVVDLREGGRPLGHTGVVFIEWPDNRWWHGYHLLSGAFKPLDDVPMVTRRATDGLPRPEGLGGWFSRARFQRLRLDLSPADPEQ